MDDIELIDQQITHHQTRLEGLRADLHRADLDLAMAEKDLAFHQAVLDEAGAAAATARAAISQPWGVEVTRSNQHELEAAAREAEMAFYEARAAHEPALVKRTEAAKRRSDVLMGIRWCEAQIEQLTAQRTRLEEAARAANSGVLGKLRARVTANLTASK
jgi:hypothetical protein